jgi:hypothetical protein
MNVYSDGLFFSKASIVQNGPFKTGDGRVEAMPEEIEVQLEVNFRVRLWI